MLPILFLFFFSCFSSGVVFQRARVMYLYRALMHILDPTSHNTLVSTLQHYKPISPEPAAIEQGKKISCPSCVLPSQLSGPDCSLCILRPKPDRYLHPAPSSPPATRYIDEMGRGGG